MSEFGKDPDDLHGDDVVFEINIDVMGDGCVRLSGDIYEKKYAIDCIDAAKAAVNRHNERPMAIKYEPPKITRPDEIMHSIQIKVRRNGNMSTGGAITNPLLANMMLDHARDTINAYHNKLHGGTVCIPSKDTEFGNAIGVY